jgi:hypothetical protein
MDGEKSKQELLLDTITDLVSDLLYYDRKEDEELSADDIEDLLHNGGITIDEMVEKFRECLVDALE